MMQKICPHFGSCGGCSQQGVPYAAQLMEKEKRVRSQLSSLAVETILPILPSPEEVFYRNKMEYSFGNEVDIRIFNESSSGLGRASDSHLGRHFVHLGLHPRKRFALVMPTPECQLMSLESQKILQVVSDWANEFQVPVFVRKNGEGHLRHLVVREGKNTGERMVKLVAKSMTKHVEILADKLRESQIPITTFLWSLHDGLSDVAFGSENKIYWGAGSIRERIGRVEVKVTATSFLQTNTRAAEGMLKVLQSWMAGDEVKIIDLYCGSGTIGLNLAGSRPLIGIELNATAVAEARSTANENGFLKAAFFQGLVEKLIESEPSLVVDDNTLVVVDPPRPGLHPAVVETLLTWAPAKLFYVSCNPESLSRDLRRLSARYTIQAVQPMDFFPHTDHIETAVHLVRNKVQT